MTLPNIVGTPVGVTASGVKGVDPIAPNLIPGLQAWWDATDASTFTYSSAALVSQWRDKSGNSRHWAQATPAAQPTRDTTINGVVALQFRKSATWLDVPAFAQPFVAGELFAVLTSGTESGDGWISFTNIDSQHYPFLDGQIYDPWGTSARKTCGNPVTDLKIPHTYNVQSATGSYVVMINNSEALFSTATNTVQFAGLPHQIGKTPAGTTFDGRIGEIVIYNRIMDAAERKGLHVYLRTKWGLP